MLLVHLFVHSTFSKHVKWRLSCTVMTYIYFDKSNRHMGIDTYHSRTPGLILGFRGFKSTSNFGDSCFFLDFGTSYVALFNGLMISDIRILVLRVYSLFRTRYLWSFFSSSWFHGVAASGCGTLWTFLFFFLFEIRKHRKSRSIGTCRLVYENNAMKCTVIHPIQAVDL